MRSNYDTSLTSQGSKWCGTTHPYLFYSVCQKANTPALIIAVLTRCYIACLQLHDNSLQRVVYCACTQTKRVMLSIFPYPKKEVTYCSLLLWLSLGLCYWWLRFFPPFWQFCGHQQIYALCLSLCLFVLVERVSTFSLSWQTGIFLLISRSATERIQLRQTAIADHSVRAVVNR